MSRRCQCDQALREAVAALIEYAGHVDDGHPGSIPVPMRLIAALKEAMR